MQCLYTTFTQSRWVDCPEETVISDLLRSTGEVSFCDRVDKTSSLKCPTVNRREVGQIRFLPPLPTSADWNAITSTVIKHVLDNSALIMTHLTPWHCRQERERERIDSSRDKILESSLIIHSLMTFSVIHLQRLFAPWIILVSLHESTQQSSRLGTYTSCMVICEIVNFNFKWIEFSEYAYVSIKLIVWIEYFE